jgi:hypothetical protein
MIEKKKLRSILWMVVMTYLLAGLLVGCNASHAGLETTYPYPAPAEAHSTEVMPSTGEIEPGIPVAPGLEDPIIVKVVDKARQDLAERLSLPVDQIELREVRKVTWPDDSLGCPQPGMDYAQVQQAGLLIRLSASGSIFFYHSGTSLEPFLCENFPLNLEASPKEDELLPPPDSEVD